MVKNVGIILICSVLAKLLSYAWEMALAAFFGASDQADAFYMMYSILLAIYPILDMGIWKVFLPLYKTRQVDREEERADSFANAAICLFTALVLVLVLVLYLFANQTVVLFAPGFSPEKREATASYLRMALPMLLLMPATSVVAAVLQSHGSFWGSQIREIATHVTRILVFLLFFRRLNMMAAVLAMIVGSVFRLLAQIPFLDWGWRFRAVYRNGRVMMRMEKWEWRFRPNFRFRSSDIGRMLKGLPSVSITVAIGYINGLVDKVIASGAGSGAIACLNYGHKLVGVFSGMLSGAIGTATYPTMIQYIAEGKTGKLRKLLTDIIGVLAFLIIPISLFCAAFSRELVTVAFQRGAFDAAATGVTAAVFLAYSLGMFFEGVTTVITNVFYGYGDTRTTMLISVVNVLMNIVLNLVFVRFWGVAGLALATSLSTGLCLLIRLALLRRYLRLNYRRIALECFNILLISGIAVGLACFLFRYLLHLPPLLTLAGAAIVIAAVGIGLSLLLRVNAISFLRRLLRAKLRKKNP